MSIEIDRKLFLSLIKTEGRYIYTVLNDQNYIDDFFADSDEEARKIFRERKWV